MKFCADCRWHRPSEHGSQYDKCESPNSYSEPNPVRGEKVQHRNYCSGLRQRRYTIFLIFWRTDKAMDHCGPGANWFESKEG